jgi:hypothetical protein
MVVHEVLSEHLFEEVNNILAANSLLAKGRQFFSFAPDVYYRIYAERQNVEASPEQVELLARTALMRLHAPVLYWLSLLPADVVGKLLRALFEDGKSPQVHTLLRLAILLGPDVSTWLHEEFERRWAHVSQPPAFYFSFGRMFRRTGVSDRRLLALRTTSFARVDDGHEAIDVGALLNSPERAAACLSNACKIVFEGNKTLRGACRDLDILAYGQGIEERSEAIGRVLMGS